LYGGIQFIHQNSLNNGGNVSQDKTYVFSKRYSNVYSGQIGVKINSIDVSFNYTHISNEGRYLFPREWGKDPFYTFMPRERNEGLSGLNAFCIKILFSHPASLLKIGLSGGLNYLPDVKDVKKNKYGMPSYGQVNLDMRYSFTKKWIYNY